MARRWSIIFVAIFGVAFSGCGKKKLSDRQIRREQIRVNAEAKRAELSKVAGQYSGELVQQDGSKQAVALTLEVKDVAYDEDGQIDSLMVPSLAGYFNFASWLVADGNKALGFAVERAEYDGKSSALSLSVTNETYKSIIMDLRLADNVLTGGWTAPNISTSGTVRLVRGTNLNDPNAKDELSGSYTGYLQWDSEHQFQRSDLALQVTVPHPNSMAVTGLLKAYFGERVKNEFQTFQFTHVDVNPVSKQITIKDDAAEISLIGSVQDGGLAGVWYTKARGKMGNFVFSKTQTVVVPDNSWELVPEYRGTYPGKLENISDNTNLAERMILTLTIANTESVGNPTVVGGNIRLWFGGGENEYQDFPFSETSLNFYTHAFAARTTGQYRFLIKGEIKDGVVNAALSADGIGDVATIKAEKI